MHLTLAFLGWTPDERLDAVVAAARGAADRHHGFELSFAGAGHFPATGRPRVVWLGIGEGAAPLAALAGDVASELRVRELRLDDRPFAPHLTLARVRDEATGPEGRTIAAAVKALVVPPLRMRVERIVVVESVLRRTGPTYKARAELPLRG